MGGTVNSCNMEMWAGDGGRKRTEPTWKDGRWGCDPMYNECGYHGSVYGWGRDVNVIRLWGNKQLSEILEGRLERT